jgi:hypothetical protein
VVHVAGTCMIHQGTDGLSCGLLMDGVFAGALMSLHITLHLSAIDHSSSIVAWVQSWCPESTIHTLTPAEWYTKGHGWHRYEKNSDGVPMPKPAPTQCLLWTPPPTAGRFAMDELAISRHTTFLFAPDCSHLSGTGPCSNLRM